MPLKMDRTTLPARIGIVFVQSFQKPQALVQDQKSDMLQAPVLQLLRKSVPGFQVFLAHLYHSNNFAIAFPIHADRHQDRNGFDFAALHTLEPDTIHKKWILMLKSAVALGFDPLKDLQVQFPDGSRTDPTSPEDLGNVLDLANHPPAR